MISQKHLTALRESGITDELIEQRGYRTVENVGELRTLGFGEIQLNVPTLLIPTHSAAGEVVGYQHRPDNPRVNAQAKEIKYESPAKQRNRLDIHPSRAKDLSNPKIPLLITEGVKKGDSAAAHGHACIALTGVWGWRSKNQDGGKTAVPDWQDVALNGRKIGVVYDSDIMTKTQVRDAAMKLGAYLESKGAEVTYIILPELMSGKTGLDDFLVETGGADPWQHGVAKLPRPGLEQAGIMWQSESALATAWMEERGFEFKWRADVKEWVHFRDGRWTDEGGNTHVRRSIGEFLDDLSAEAQKRGDMDAVIKLGATTKLDNVRKRANTLLPLIAYRGDFDSKPHLFNVANGTIDLRTGELLDHNPEDALTQVSPIVYDPEAKSPSWDRFIRWALPSDDVRNYVQELLGQALYGEVREHVLPIFYGPGGGNGKGTTVRAISNVFGQEYSATPSRSLLLAKRFESHPTMYASLYNRRLVVSEEAFGKTSELDVTLTKTLTGGDQVNARYMRQDEFSFTPTHTLIAVTNDKPVIDGEEEALWRRLKLIPFLSKVSKPDPTLEDRLKAEAPGILLWLLEGCRRWYDRGYLVAPVEVEAATAAFKVETDPLSEYWGERVDETGKADDRLFTSELHQDYLGWMKDAHPDVTPLNPNALVRRVGDRWGLQKEKIRRGGDYKQGYKGLKLRDVTGSPELTSGSWPTSSGPVEGTNDGTNHDLFQMAQKENKIENTSGPGLTCENKGLAQKYEEVGIEEKFSRTPTFEPFRGPGSDDTAAGTELTEFQAASGTATQSDLSYLDTMRQVTLDGISNTRHNPWRAQLFQHFEHIPRCPDCQSPKQMISGSRLIFVCPECYPSNFED